MCTGNMIHKRINTETVLTVLRLFVLIGSIPLTGAGDGSLFGTAIAGVYGVLALLFIVVPLAIRRRQAARASLHASEAVGLVALPLTAVDHVLKPSELGVFPASDPKSKSSPTSERKGEEESLWTIK